MNSNLTTKAIGATLLTIATNAVTTVSAEAFQIGALIEARSVGASGVVALVSGTSFVGASATANGFIFGSILDSTLKKTVEVEGPAKFFLAASGSSVTVQLLKKYTSGSAIG